MYSCKSNHLQRIKIVYAYGVTMYAAKLTILTHLCRPVRSIFAVREIASLDIMGAPRVPPLNPSETIVLPGPISKSGNCYVTRCVPKKTSVVPNLHTRFNWSLQILAN